MRFTLSVATAVMAFAASAFAQTADFDPVTKPESNEVVPAGETYEITWTAPAKYAGDADTISISLIGGETQDTQVPLTNIASGIKNSAGSYSWAVDSSLGAENVYGLVVKLESNPDIFQYSNPFKIKAGGSGESSDGASTVVITTDTGIKTIHLSTTEFTTVPCTTSTTPSSTPTPTPTPSKTKTVKSSTSVTPVPKPTTIVTSNVVVPPPSTTAPATIPPTETPGAAPRVGAGSLAVFGGLVVAALAL